MYGQLNGANGQHTHRSLIRVLLLDSALSSCARSSWRSGSGARCVGGDPRVIECLLDLSGRLRDGLSGLFLDPEASVDGSAIDPIPGVLNGF